MKLILGNKLISDNSMEDILYKLREDCGGRYLKDIGNIRGNNIKITCPYHANGEESHPSCFVYCDDKNDSVMWGLAHCFTCGKKVPIYSLIGYCLGEDSNYGKEWLKDNFGNTFVSQVELLDEIIIDKPKDKIKKLDESILEEYSYMHPYHFKRGLTEEIIKKYKIGFDEKTNCMTMPVWDEKGNLVTITRRSVVDKKFILESNIDKPVYLLNFVLKENKNEPIYVCESQINALTLRTWGYQSIALFGTGSKHQYDILNKSGIRNYMLCFDGDEAGDKGARRFIDNVKDCIISIKQIPRGKDVNDLSKKEFENLLVI